MGGGRFASSYKALALLVLSTAVVLLVLNLAAAAALALLDGLTPPPGPLRYGMDKLARVYPGMEPAEIEQLLRESWSSGYVYSPFVQHREPARRGRFVNVDSAGFRRSENQGPWPPAADALNIFVFGGSTSFGYGVADSQTIASRLQAALAADACDGRPPRVYNFGRGNYYSEQERVLFEQLLAAGAVPDVALFVDGLNEWKSEPKFTRRLTYLLEESDGQLIRRGLKTVPLVRLLKAVRARRGAELDLDPVPTGVAAGDELARQAVRRWLRGRRIVEAVAVEFDVLPLFVWQPVPTWEYEIDAHLFAAESAGALALHGPLRAGYDLMDQARSADPELRASSDFLWLADIQRGRREPFYVDAAHYTAAFSDEIARRIARFVAARLPCAAVEPE